MKIVVTGSYNGQDSLGDECLMKAVVERVNYHRSDAVIEVQLHDTDQPVVQSHAKAHGLEVNKGLQSAMWRMSHVLQRLRVPRAIAEAGADHGIALAAKFGLFGATDALERLERSDAFFIYGGTQFSGQWFELNAPAYLKSAKLVRSSGGRVFFGPQQYGPFFPGNEETLLDALETFVNDWRTRSPLDAEHLEPVPEQRQMREVYDEVFSATRLYPQLHPKPRQHILVNLRAMSFDNNATLDREIYRPFARLVDLLIDEFGLPALFFGVSNATFCDDDAAFSAIRDMSKSPQMLSSVGRVRDEYQLFKIAQEARLTISMSFHGCLLSAIAGAPFVPVTEGDYYDYKYVGFDKYTGGQDTPLINLSGCDPKVDCERIVALTARFDPSLVSEVRLRASEMADSFYHAAIGR